jgi:natural resistance-associated macrophage protein
VSANAGQADDKGSDLPAALLSRNPLRWLTIFGPGAVIASLTIGAGELIFSSRGGAIFGYRLLWFFALILVAKWALVLAAARHIVLTGAHPFQRWMEFPGPRGWLPIALFLLAMISFPIWVCFHAGIIGTLLSGWAGTQNSLHGSAHYLWGMGVLAAVLVLVFTGGYQRLERVQLVIVILMLLCVVISVLVLKPDWLEFLKGLFVPRALEYPDWIARREEFIQRPVWVETITYVGVLGGSGYDYLAYVSYLRDKHWGQAGGAVATRAELDAMAANPSHLNRRWLRAVWIDCTLSFAAVLVFSAVFVACGAMILGPAHQIPSGNNLLALQAEFVTPIFPWLKYVYFLGAFLTILGTLYGTIEVAPAVLREIAYALNPQAAATNRGRLRRWSVLWVGLGGFVILVGSLLHYLRSRAANPPGLIAILTPANLFTGVLACGFICLLSVWVECRFVPRGLRMNWWLTSLNALAGVIFLALGAKAYWDHSQWKALLLLTGTIAMGWVAAWVLAGQTVRTRLGFFR